MYETVSDILGVIQRMPPEQRREAIARVRAELDTIERENCPEPASDQRRQAAMQEWLAMDGAFHSDFTDVSTNKNKHLAKTYATRR